MKVETINVKQIFLHVKNYDEKFLKRILLKEHRTNEPKIIETFEHLVRKDALDLARNVIQSDNPHLLQV
jgi:hypothetical protein